MTFSASPDARVGTGLVPSLGGIMLDGENAQKRQIVGWRRTDDRDISDEFVITSSTDPSTIDTGDWESIYATEPAGEGAGPEQTT